MKVKNLTSMVTTKQLKKIILKNVPEDNKVNKFKFTLKDGKAVCEIEVTKSVMGYKTDGLIELEEQDLLEYGQKILEKQSVPFVENSLEISIKHVEGDSMEPMDYGYNEFEGIKFKMKSGV